MQTYSPYKSRVLTGCGWNPQGNAMRLPSTTWYLTHQESRHITCFICFFSSFSVAIDLLKSCRLKHLQVTPWINPTRVMKSTHDQVSSCSRSTVQGVCFTPFGSRLHPLLSHVSSQLWNTEAHGPPICLLPAARGSRPWLAAASPPCVSLALNHRRWCGGGLLWNLGRTRDCGGRVSLGTQTPWDREVATKAFLWNDPRGRLYLCSLFPAIHTVYSHVTIHICVLLQSVWTWVSAQNKQKHHKLQPIIQQRLQLPWLHVSVTVYCMYSNCRSWVQFKLTFAIFSHMICLWACRLLDCAECCWNQMECHLFCKYVAKG